MNTQFDTKQNKKQNGLQPAAKDRRAEALGKSHFQRFSTEQAQSDFALPIVREMLNSAGQPAETEALFQHDFSRVQLQATRPATPLTSQTAACPMFPRSCPTGGACHTCPAKVQPKLTINQPGDKYEQEADRVAEQMLRVSNPDSVLEDDSISTSMSASENIQRLTTTQAAPSGIHPAAGEVLASEGYPLEAATRSFVEPRFGYDFSRVRVHTNTQAAQSASALRAQAYTIGQNIVFGAGQYNPQTAVGQQLLTHELAHVVQQRDAASRHIQRRNGGTATTSSASTAARSRPVREERFNIGRGGHRFDAELNRRDCLLTLKMKVAFNFLARGGRRTRESWPSPAAQRTWQQNFIRAVTNRWSFRYYLEPDAPCPAETCTRAYSRVQVLPVTSNPHFTINVSHTTDFEGSSVGRRRVSPAVGRRATMDALDVRQRTDIPQVPAEHEFGHMLGLPHVRCDRNARICYGRTAGEKANIMGLGRIVSARDYRVFAEAMYYFNGCNWHATHGRPTPSRRPMGDFPVPTGETRHA